MSDYPFWSRNARSYLTFYDPLLLGLKKQAQGTCNAAMQKWCEASAMSKDTVTLLLTEAVQIQAITIIEDDRKTAHDLWKTHTIDVH